MQLVDAFTVAFTLLPGPHHTFARPPFSFISSRTHYQPTPPQSSIRNPQSPPPSLFILLTHYITPHNYFTAAVIVSRIPLPNTPHLIPRKPQKGLQYPSPFRGKGQFTALEISLTYNYISYIHTYILTIVAH